MSGPTEVEILPASTRWESKAPRDVLQGLLPEDQVRAEVALLEKQMPAILKRFTNGHAAVRSNLDEMSRLLTASTTMREDMADRSFPMALWKKLTGKEGRERTEIQTNLARVQARAACVLERLLDRQSYLDKAVNYLGGRIELLAIENVKLKMVLVQLGNRIFDRLESLEHRVTDLEKQVRLIELFQSGYSEQLGEVYRDVAARDPLLAALGMARDFVLVTDGQWRSLDIIRLRRMAEREAGLSEDVSFAIADLVEKGLLLHENPVDASLVLWMKNDALYDRLMDSLEEGGTRSLRERFPVHFLLNRPIWFIKQGFRHEDLPSVRVQVGQYLDQDVALDYWKLMCMLLEERLAWRLESSRDSATSAEPTESPKKKKKKKKASGPGSSRGSVSTAKPTEAPKKKAARKPRAPRKSTTKTTTPSASHPLGASRTRLTRTSTPPEIRCSSCGRTYSAKVKWCKKCKVAL